MVIIGTHKNNIPWNSSNPQPYVFTFGWTILLPVTSIPWTPDSDKNTPPTERKTHAAHVACVAGLTLWVTLSHPIGWRRRQSKKTGASLLLINACRPAYGPIWVVSCNCQSMHSFPIGHRCAGGVVGLLFSSAAESTSFKSKGIVFKAAISPCLISSENTDRIFLVLFCRGKEPYFRVFQRYLQRLDSPC